MDLHYHSDSEVTQLETLLRHARGLIAELKEATSGTAAHGKTGHLANTLDMLTGVALGFEWTVLGTVDVITALEAERGISKDGADRLLDVVHQHLGQMYMHGALMAAQNKA